MLSIIYISSILRSIFIMKSFDKKTKLEKILFLVAVFIATIFCLDLIIQGDLYPDNILKFYEFVDSINFAIWFFLGIISLIGSGFFLKILFTNSNFDREDTFSKIITLASVPVSFLIVLNFILAGDVTSNLQAEDHAKYFVELICNDKLSFMNYQNIVCSDDYCRRINENKSFFVELKNTNFRFEDFKIAEYFYRSSDNTNPDTAKLILKATTICNIEKSKDALESIIQVDYYFNIRLVEVYHNSKFLGKYKRWAIDDFSYLKGDKYSLKDWIERLKIQKENQ